MVRESDQAVVYSLPSLLCDSAIPREGSLCSSVLERSWSRLRVFLYGREPRLWKAGRTLVRGGRNLRRQVGCSALLSSSATGAGCGLNLVSPFIFRFMQAVIHISASPFSKVCPLGFGRPAWLRLRSLAWLQAFWPLVPLQQALPAILFLTLSRFGGPALLRGLRPSSSWGVPFWPSGLTLRLSGPASCGPLI